MLLMCDMDLLIYIASIISLLIIDSPIKRKHMKTSGSISVPSQEINRRKVVKGAAWSIPVIAAAVAAPSAAASGDPVAGWDVGITGTCSGTFKADGLASNVLNALTGILGLKPAIRNFRISAHEGTIPAGTRFQLSHGGILDLNLFAWSTLGLTLLSPGPVATLSLTNPLPFGQSITIDLMRGLVDVKLASTVSLTLVGSDAPSSTTSPGGNSAIVRTVLGTTVNPLGLIDVNLQACG